MGGTETSEFWQPMSWATESGGSGIAVSGSTGQASGAVANSWDTVIEEPGCECCLGRRVEG